MNTEQRNQELRNQKIQNYIAELADKYQAQNGGGREEAEKYAKGLVFSVL